MQILKKSLRAKLTLVLFLVGIIPLGAASLFFYFSTKDALFKNVFKELKWNVNDISQRIENHFGQTGRDLVIASQNTAFTMYFLDPADRAYWLKEQKKTLLHLRSIYRGMLDEACFIESSGKEVSRIVLDRVSRNDELSSDEDRTAFFKEAFKLKEGEVYQGRPAVSDDTKRWVLPNATLIFVNGKKEAILHFEITMGYFQRLLKDSINPDRGYGFIINDRGEFMAHTLMELGEDKPFPLAINEKTTGPLASIYRRMMEGESGIEQFYSGNETYYIIFRPIKASYFRGRNDNRWSIGYAIPGSRVYVELAILRYNIIMLLMTAALVTVLAYVIGNYVSKPIRVLAGATHKVAAGEMPKIELKREDEIGVLSDSFNMMVEAIKRRDEALKSLATTDGLTGLNNYRHFKSALEKEVKSSLRFTRPLSLIMADVDHFKHYNDTHGHVHGDMALKRVAEVFMKNTREVDFAARYGGEEFAVILPETGLEEALKIAERIRSKVEEEVIPFEESQPNGALTVSIGVAVLPDDAVDAASLIDAADKALYRAKVTGRNRVHSYAEG